MAWNWTGSMHLLVEAGQPADGGGRKGEIALQHGHQSLTSDIKSCPTNLGKEPFQAKETYTIWSLVLLGSAVLISMILIKMKAKPVGT